MLEPRAFPPHDSVPEYVLCAAYQQDHVPVLVATAVRKTSDVLPRALPSLLFFDQQSIMVILDWPVRNRLRTNSLRSNLNDVLRPGARSRGAPLPGSLRGAAWEYGQNFALPRFPLFLSEPSIAAML
jgi:hypothetical protein